MKEDDEVCHKPDSAERIVLDKYWATIDYQYYMDWLGGLSSELY